MDKKPDDLDAVRSITSTLAAFDKAEQERILRWAMEKLGLSTAATLNAPSSSLPKRDALPLSHASKAKDIKSFVAEKSPSSDKEFAATVAYYYRFVAPEAERKDAITPDDLQGACRLTGRKRLSNPGQTLINAHTGGLLDKGADRGNYKISTVGENLVAVTLPSGGDRPTTRQSRPAQPAKKSKKLPRKQNAKILRKKTKR